MPLLWYSYEAPCRFVFALLCVPANSYPVKTYCGWNSLSAVGGMSKDVMSYSVVQNHKPKTYILSFQRVKTVFCVEGLYIFT